PRGLIMFYSIRHVTRFQYGAPVSESVMEIRMRPRTEGRQRCLFFELKVHPRSRIFYYRDYLGNMVHHFDVPGRYTKLQIIAEAQVQVDAPAEMPESLEAGSWEELDDMVAAGDYWEMLMPSHFAVQSPLLTELRTSLELERGPDPLSLMRRLNAVARKHF